MRRTTLWYLYDFANSFASIVLIFYYPLILSEKGINDAWIGIAASVSTIILLFLTPFLGHVSDRTGKRIPFLRWVTFFIVLSLLAIAYLVSYQNIERLPILVTVSFFYILFQVSFQGTGVFYSSMLRGMSDEKTSSRISGIGVGLGQLGNAICLALVGPVITVGVIILGLSGKPLALAIGAILFAAIAFPFLLSRDFAVPIPNQPKFSYRIFLRKIISDRNILWFVIGYSLLADAILTFQLYATIYLRKVFSLGDSAVTYVGVVGLLFAVIGGFLSGILVTRLKNKKNALVYSAILYAISFVGIALVPPTIVAAYASIALGGLAFGFVFSIARALYAELVPQEEQAGYFSAYTVFEKAASVIGPLVWIVSFNLLSFYGENIQYRGSVLFLTIICLLGILALRKVRTRL